ncbi:hypothetical protein BDZ90DRAFT_233959 [Jaminaea rosea]|uniref:Uncharacterized protein n=1 Tax=Jaminaea rosea TaxID=1569628 RepID=A0A316UKQ5_9BASI|nr:hypothetical protein BDZ90DRAFT_233959 [Jaminaea rosea]PWN25514.1 hypothetical protein BDZ90DRAFT_233959 [Jaminaea rosea]
MVPSDPRTVPGCYSSSTSTSCLFASSAFRGLARPISCSIAGTFGHRWASSSLLSRTLRRWTLTVLH